MLFRITAFNVDLSSIKMNLLGLPIRISPIPHLSLGAERDTTSSTYHTDGCSYQAGIYVSMCSATTTFTDKTIYLLLCDGRTQSLVHVASIVKR